MIIRPATYNDIDEAARIYDLARSFMKETGNPNQWPGSYPGAKEIKDGVDQKTGYVCCDGEEIVATFHFEADADDPTYRKIFEGEWKNDLPYGVIHRIAVKYHGRGIVDFCFNECFKIISK